jgi:hypothetical protein
MISFRHLKPQYIQYTISVLDWTCLILEFFAGILSFYFVYLQVITTPSPHGFFDTAISLLSTREFVVQIIIFLLIIVIFALTAFSAVLRSLRRRHLRSILRLNWDLGVLIILPSLTVDDDRNSVKRVTPVDGNDAARIFPPLLEAAGVAGSSISVRMANEISNEDLLNNNAIVIGGHLTNELSAIVVHMSSFDRKCSLVGDQIKCPQVHIDIEYDRTNGNKEDPDNGTDYCLITRDIMPNGSKSRTFWAFEGIRHWGTRGALQMIGDVAIREHRKALLAACPRLKKAGEIQMIATCRFNVSKDFNEKSSVLKCFWRGDEQQVKTVQARRVKPPSRAAVSSQSAG